MILTFGVSNQGHLMLNAVPDGAEVINLSSVSTVWIHTDSSIASGVGVPLYPNTSLTKRGTGPLYAILDSGSSIVATVIVADGLSNYDNPVAIAAAVATELLASGIPNVMTQQVLNTAAIASGASFGPIDVSLYATLIIVSDPLIGSFNVTFDLLPGAGGAPVYSGMFEGPISLAVQAQWFTLTNTSGSSIPIRIVGTNRPIPPTRWQTALDEQLIAEWNSNGLPTPLVAGTTYTLPGNGITPNLPAGPASLYWGLNSAVVLGLLQLTDATGRHFPIADTSELKAFSNGRQAIIRPITIPYNNNNSLFASFACQTGGAINANTFDVRIVGGNQT